MKSTSFRRAILPGVAVIAMALSACGGADAGADSGSGQRCERLRGRRRLVDRVPDEQRGRRAAQRGEP